MTMNQSLVWIFVSPNIKMYYVLDPKGFTVGTLIAQALGWKLLSLPDFTCRITPIILREKDYISAKDKTQSISALLVAEGIKDRQQQNKKISCKKLNK